MKKIHGKIFSDSRGDLRYCKVHGEHGRLAICPEYSKKTLREISAETEKHHKQLFDPQWIKENTHDQYGIHILRALAGFRLTPESGIPI